MSIIEKDKVDAIGIEKETGIVVLSIADHLDWTDPLQHIFLLQAKLNSYLAFLESGEILEKYPNAKNKGIRIDLYAKYECSDEKSKKIISNFHETIKKAGYSLKINYDLEGQ